MSTEILGYIAAPTQQTAEKPTEKPVKATEKSKGERYYRIMQRLVGVMLFELGLLSLTVSGGDGTFFVMMLFFSLPLLFSEKKMLTERRKDK